MATVGNACRSFLPVNTRSDSSRSHVSDFQTRVTVKTTVQHQLCCRSTNHNLRALDVKRRDIPFSCEVRLKNSRSHELYISRATSRKGAPGQHSFQKSDAELSESSLESAEILPSTQPGDANLIQHRLDTLNTVLQRYFMDVRSGWKLIMKNSNPLAAMAQVLAKEWKIIYLMTCNDVPSAVLPYWCIGLNVLAVSPFLQTGDFNHFWFQAVTTMSKEIIYSFLYLYCFNLANQYMGVRGDTIDKPWRPIPAGLLTREGDLARWFLANLLYSFVSWHLGVLHWTLLWQSVIAGQFLGFEKDSSSRGLGRSIAMWVGTVVLCSAGVSLATPMTPALLFWAVTRGAAAANHHWMQDFRDIEGDQKIGRTTFPLLFGVQNARKLMAFIFAMDPVFLHFVVMKDSGYTTPQLIAESLGVLLSAVLAYRVMNCKTPAEDHDTYTTWLTTLWHNFAFLLVGPAFLVGSSSYL